MNSIKVLLVALCAIFSSTAFAQSDSTNFKVAGNCGMCKKRIEASVKSPSVSFANWDVKSKVLTIKFDPSKTSAQELQRKVAAVGHDTEKYSADKEVYERLPGCCLYDREMLRSGTLKPESKFNPHANH